MLSRYVKSMVKSTLSPLLDAGGLYDRRIATASGARGSWIIVMYHRVVENPMADPFRLGMCVLRERFSAQVRYLRENFNVIGLCDAVGRLEAGDALPERAVSITFDDGYLDNLEIALPILKSYRMPATLFVPTGGLEDGEPLWWDRVIAAFAGTTRSAFDAPAAGLPGVGSRLSLSRWRRPASVETVLEQLWKLPIEETQEIVCRIERQLGPQQRPVVPAARLTRAQVREMHRQGVEIGAHSVRHPNMKLLQEHEVRSEMLASRKTLQEICDAPIEGFAYPGGRMNEGTAQAARTAGFRYAVATTTAINEAPYERFRLSRIGMPDSGLADFKRSLSAAMRRPAGASGSARPDGRI